MDKPFTTYQVEDRSYVSYIRREIHREISNYTFSQRQVGEIDIIVSELSSNLIKHAGKGEFLYRVYNSDEGGSVFEIISIDRGPGMVDPAKMMQDGVSTTNTLGQGLGAIKRLSGSFQLYSKPQWGAILYAQYSSTKKGHATSKKGFNLDVKALSVNKTNEKVCGDGFEVKRTESTIQLFLGDGLGHGEYANDAVVKAAESFSSSKESDPVQILLEMHEKVRKTRGLVASVAVLDLERKVWKLCGIGNIITRIYSGIEYKNYMAYNGTIGLNIPTSLKESVFKIEKNQHLVMNSDGIRSRWDLTRYPSIFKYGSMVAAAAIYKDFSRRTDDTSILIAKVL